VFEVAASDHNGSRSLFRGDKSTMWNRLIRETVEVRRDTISVSARTIDSILAECGWPPIVGMKIDVEGAEWHVLKGMRASLERWSPGLLLEIHPPQLKRSGHSESEVLRLLDELGYARQLVGSPSPSGVYTIYARRS